MVSLDWEQQIGLCTRVVFLLSKEKVRTSGGRTVESKLACSVSGGSGPKTSVAEE